MADVEESSPRTPGSDDGHVAPNVELRGLVCCPADRTALGHGDGFDPARGMPWPDGEVSCAAGHRYPVEGGIPRFVSADNYSAAFGLQWQRYRRTQLDSYTGVPMSRIRLERCLGMPLEALGEKRVLEVGSGAGRFTELLIPHCGALVSLDMSSAVEANLQNCRDLGAYSLVQADLREAPLEPASFDVVICLGVVQHTPDPEQTLGLLASFLRPGGTIAIDHYAYRSDRWGRLFALLTTHSLVRQIAKRLPPDQGLRLTVAFSAISDPIRRRTCRYPQLDRWVARVLATACYYETNPELPTDICREWNELDTHDSLTDWYQHRRTAEQIEASLDALGFADIWCAKGIRGGNGIEAHARKR